MDERGNWGQTLGLGAKADVLPEINRTQIKRSTPDPLPHDPGRETTPGVGEQPLPPPPPIPDGPRPEGPGPIDDYTETPPPPPKATDPDFTPRPYDPGTETIPGAGEQPRPRGGQTEPLFPTRPYDPGTETIPGAGEVPRVPNPAEGRSKGTTPPAHIPEPPPIPTYTGNPIVDAAISEQHNQKKAADAAKRKRAADAQREADAREAMRQADLYSYLFGRGRMGF